MRFTSILYLLSTLCALLAGIIIQDVTISLFGIGLALIDIGLELAGITKRE